MEEGMRQHRAQRGVTLVEAGVVLAIGAITLGTVAPGFQRFIEKQKLEGAAAQLATDIQFTRAESVLRNEALRLAVQHQPWGACYVIHSGTPASCTCKADGVAECTGGARQLKTVVFPSTEALALASNVASIGFDPMHGTSTPAGTFTLTTRSGRAIEHIVNLMGRVRTCAIGLAGHAAC
jgi:type IV fimbrial biogenesis protein FimT